MRLTEAARAKVNLLLHVGPLSDDGYHPLVSLAVFANVGDVVSVEPAEALGLTVTGPFAGAAPAGPDNLVLRAVQALAEAVGRPPNLHLGLDKRLPIAAGLGGGSADAAAALRLAARVWNVALDDPRLMAVAEALGSDVPMCVRSEMAWAEGRGERLTPAPWLGPLHAVLVNPGVPSPTGPVYRAYDAAPRPLEPRPAAPKPGFAVVVEWLAGQRNDLEAPAIALTPAIGDALETVRADPGVAFARMSGSGATVFGLCADADEAASAADRLVAAHPGWWVKACVLGGALQAERFGT